MAKPHPSFRQPENNSCQLWRYMDLAKFVALVQTQSLYFARSDTLGDPFEGSVTKVNHLAAEIIKEQKTTNPVFAQYADWTDEKIDQKYQSLAEARARMRETVFINCWHQSDYESAAMWSLYSDSNYAICIRTTYELLMEHLPKQVNLGFVEYIDYETDIIDPNNLFNAFARKRRSFEHEKEVRAVVWSMISDETGGQEVRSWISQTGMSVPLDVSTVALDVRVHPESPTWFVDVVEGIANQYNLTVEVLQSSLSSRPLF